MFNLESLEWNKHPGLLLKGMRYTGRKMFNKDIYLYIHRRKGRQIDS